MKNKKEILAKIHQNRAYAYREELEYWRNEFFKSSIQHPFIAWFKGYPSKGFILHKIEFFEFMAEIEYHTVRFLMNIE